MPTPRGRRHVAARSQVLLLDEPTSALDPESEVVVQEALSRLVKGRTVLVVAHRLSTVKDADAICVMRAGRVVERGTHAELVALGGEYAEMIAAQNREQRPSETAAAP